MRMPTYYHARKRKIHAHPHDIKEYFNNHAFKASMVLCNNMLSKKSFIT